MGTQAPEIVGIINDYFQQIWREQKYDQLSKFVNPEAKFHTPMKDFKGIEAVKNYIQQFHSSIEGFKLEIMDLVHQDNKVVASWKISGRCSKFFGVPCHATDIKFRGITLYVFENGKIQNGQICGDFASVLIQLGAIKPIFK